MSPWDRLPSESAAAYRAFIVYRDMGTDRSLSAVARRLKTRTGGDSEGAKNRAPSRIKHWSTTHRWVERAAAWDAMLQGAADAVRIQEAERWERRRLRQLEAAYDDGSRLRRKGRELLDQPVEETKPAVFVAAATLLSRAAELGAAACQVMVTDLGERDGETTP